MSVVTGFGPVNVGGMSDDELVRLARDGHEDAFNAIVRRYRAPLVSYCRRWLDAGRAEEVVQHTMMKAFLCLRDDDRPLVLRPWLYRVAHNAALNALEKKGNDWDELDENYDGVPQPPQVAEKRAHFLKVVHEIEELPLRQRQALVLNEFEGRCYADIATELGTSESGVRGLLRRARRQLRDAAAAILLPFPALRELVRSDAGRSFQTERAGELIGSAGAAGGLSAASGGFAKIAAGVLAAGTLAGGGTALEHARPWKTSDAKAREVTKPVTAEVSNRLVAGTDQTIANAVNDSVNSSAAEGELGVEHRSPAPVYDGAPIYTYTYTASAEMGTALEEPAPESEAPAEEQPATPLDDLVPDDLAPDDGAAEEEPPAKSEPNTVKQPSESESRQPPPAGNADEEADRGPLGGSRLLPPNRLGAA